MGEIRRTGRNRRGSEGGGGRRRDRGGGWARDGKWDRCVAPRADAWLALSN